MSIDHPKVGHFCDEVVLLFFKFGVATVFETGDANSLSKTGICLVPDLTLNLNSFPGFCLFWLSCIFGIGN